MNGLVKSVQENVVFFLEFAGIVVLMTAIAYAAEKYIRKKEGVTERSLTTGKITIIGMISAIAAILHMLDFPVPFAPFFYKLDFSELPALIAAFAFGPVAGVMIEFCKILIKLLFKNTSTAFVGDMANFVIGCSFLVPASITYLFRKSKKTAVIGCVIGTLCMTVFGSAFNAVYLIPAFSKLYGMPLEEIIGIGTRINPAINNTTTLVMYAVAPLNLLKGSVVSLVTVLVYKKLSPVLKKTNRI